MHNLRLIQRRFPRRSKQIIGVLLLLSLSALALGIGLLLLS